MRKSVASRDEVVVTAGSIRAASARRVGSGVWLDEHPQSVVTTERKTVLGDGFIANDVSGLHSRRSTCERGVRRGLIALGLVLSIGCKSSDTAEVSHTEREIEQETEREVVTPITPRLAEIRVNDLTPEPLRDAALSAELSRITEDAFYASFTRSDDPSACRAHVTIGYAQVVNGRPVPSADDGEAHALFEGEVFCPDTSGQPRDGFRLELDAERPFGKTHGVTGPDQVRAVTRDLVREGADALFGQVRIRSSNDDAIRDALRTSDHPGVLAEAASEAGERRLTDMGDALVALTSHKNRRVAARAGAAIGLLKLDTPDAIKALVALTEGPDTEKHLVAVHALGDIGTPDAKRYLEVIALGHPNPVIRRLTRERLGHPDTAPEPAPEPVPDPIP